MNKQPPPLHGHPTNIDDILDCFNNHGEILNNGRYTDEPLTRKEIAARVERCVTPKLIAMIESMVEAQILAKHTFMRRNGIVGYEYTVIGD